MGSMLIDALILSLALRCREPDTNVRKLTEIMLSGAIVLIGPVRKEILSGISDEAAFVRLKNRLAII
ncbi:MAG: hypothetical protein FWC60_00425 [Firmicutes bacterium]|nr:hypothetical protein [Bacillota bacterium]